MATVSSTVGCHHEHLLEAALQGRVLLDALAVLVEGRGADAAQLAAREGRLEHVAASMAPSAAPAPTRVCSSSMKRMILPAPLDLLEHGLEALLELAAELRARRPGGEVEGDEALVLEALGHVAAHDALGDALDDGGLAHAGLADEHGVVLGAAGEHLHHAADLLVAADDRVELAPRASLVRSLAVLLEGLEGALGVGAR
jgi:hypothetical protein